VGDGAWLLPSSAETTQELDDLAAAISGLLIDALQAFGCPRKGSKGGAKWWNKECDQRRKEYRQLRRHAATSEDLKAAQKQFKAAVRRAKRDFWRDIISGATTDKDIFRIVSWHQPRNQLQSPALQVGDSVVSNPAQKALALRRALLERNSAEDAIPDPWTPPVPLRAIRWRTRCP